VTLPELLAELEHADENVRRQLADVLRPLLFSPAEPLQVELSIATGAAHAEVSEKTVRRAIDARLLAATMRAGRWRIRPDDLNSWLAAGAPTRRELAVTAGRPRRGASSAADAIRGTA
jgi:hypothetical protein